MLAIAALFIVGIACGGSGAADAKQAGPEYVGAWVGSDGATITIRSDGSADYKSGGTSVTGGSAQVSEKEKTLKIGLLGLGPTFKIDKAPSGNEMTLDGIVFKKGGSAPSSSTTSSAPPPSRSDDKDDKDDH